MGIVVGQISNDPFVSLELIRTLRKSTRVPVIFAPTQSSEALAIAALRLPVAEYLPQPDASEIASTVKRLFGNEPCMNGIVGLAARVLKLKKMLPKIAQSHCNVLITGETGTGKELIVEQIYSLGPRCNKPLVAVNCAAMPDSLLESELFGYERGAFTGALRRTDGLLHAAHGGVLFLDEIGDMSLMAQAKLLRAMETGKVQRVGSQVSTQVDIRFVAATHQNLEVMIQDGRFRPDLYFRLNVARVDLPALRERPEDIPLLIRHFLNEAGATSTTLSPEAEALLTSHAWPGNIRELKNVIQATLVYLTDSSIRVSDLPEAFVRVVTADSGPVREERNRLLDVLQQTHWNKSRAAEALLWSRMTLYRKLAKHGMSRCRPEMTPPSNVRKASA
jgi:DNA-binding NtrC family response regulator